VTLTDGKFKFQLWKSGGVDELRELVGQATNKGGTRPTRAGSSNFNFGIVAGSMNFGLVGQATNKGGTCWSGDQQGRKTSTLEKWRAG
jgi:hypothetical protein